MVLRVVFMGTPVFSVPSLTALHAAGHDIAAVYTQPPRKAGRRGLTLTPSPVHREAERLSIEARTPVSFKEGEEREAFAALRPDVAIVVAYGLLLPPAVLEAPVHGCLNAHGSLLPRWRGAAPIQRAIEAGDETTGVMAMQMEAGLDTGPVALTAATSIGPRETAGDLHDRLSAMAADLVVEAVEGFETGNLHFVDQQVLSDESGHEPIYARKIEKGEAELDLNANAIDVARKINAFSPFPGAWSTVAFGKQPERVKFLRAEALPANATGSSGAPGTIVDPSFTIACANGCVRILELQRAGGKPMKAADLLRGTPLEPGTVIGRR